LIDQRFLSYQAPKNARKCFPHKRTLRKFGISRRNFGLGIYQIEPQKNQHKNN